MSEADAADQKPEKSRAPHSSLERADDIQGSNLPELVSSEQRRIQCLTVNKQFLKS